MATWLHKGGESELVDARHVPGMVAAGWSFTTGESIEVAIGNANNDDATESEHEDLMVDESDSDKNGSEFDTLRAQAKKAKIKGWHLMSEETLREKLNAD